MNKLTYLLLFILFTVKGISQNSSFWKIEKEDKFEAFEKIKRSSFPKQYTVLSLDISNFKNKLVNIPIRGITNTRSNVEIILPTANGKLERFFVIETPIMEADLSNKFPMIKSYAAQGIDDPSATARFSITQFGFHGMIFSSDKSTVFIDPYTEGSDTYIVYQKSDLGLPEIGLNCLTESDSNPTLNNRNNNYQRNTDDHTLRTYRLAMSCTAEYGNIFAGTGTLVQQKANILAQMVITMTRVNGVYEKDLAVTMIFVANNDAIIYLGDVNLDPWTTEWNTKTAQTIDAAIGVNNYDIGHNFNTTGGGNAGCIACVCKSTSQTSTHKGRGYTGRANPTGDAFDIDYVAHEMGHQFGGYHVQSNTTCRSGSGDSEVEPGSGSTIMGYAGICAANVQSNSDAYFGYVNIRDILAYIKSATGGCSVNTPIPNFAPVVNAGLDYVIPKSTPFVLTATGSDPDGDPLTYCWEQKNPENPNSNAAPTSTRTAGPMFRSVNPTASPTRYFPNMTTILSGLTSNTWEVVPSIARNLVFSVVARDNVATGGQTSSDLMNVTVNSVAGPFIVNTPNTNVSWATGSNQSVTWNVAGTTANGINCNYVDIYLSNNGGTSFTTLLASKVPNDGTETVTIPNTVGTTNRIMVKGNNNIFFDVSNTNFTTTSSSSTFALAFDGQVDGQNKSICQGSSINFNINYATIGGFNSTTTLSATGAPAGSIVSFSQNTISADGTITLNISNTQSVTPGFYTITVSGTSGATTKSVNLYLQVNGSNFALVTPITPLNLANGVTNQNLTLQWSADPIATQYDLEVATNTDFSPTLIVTTTLSNSYTLSSLNQNSNYFWRVKPKNSGCQGVMSPIYRFTTGSTNCQTTASSNIPLTISATGTPTVNSTLVIPSNQNVTISKVSVSLNITHTWLSDLTVSLISPQGTTIQLFTNQCSSSDDVNATFDDLGTTMQCQASGTALIGTLIPSQSLSLLNGQNSQGTWTLRVFDGATGDGGTINNWSLSICSLNSSPLSCGQITTIWNGTSWSNGYPVGNVATVINGNYTATQDMETCSLTIQGTNSLTVASGHNLTIENDVTIGTNANLVLQNNANLIQTNNIQNSGTASIFRDTNPLKRLDYTMWSSPVTGTQTLKQFSPNTLNGRFYNYTTSINFYNFISSPNTTLFQTGKGYLIRTPDNHPTTPSIWTGQFIGTPKNGTISIPLEYYSDSQGYNAIGNPYPSNISADLFLQNNSTNIEGILYFWRKTNNALGSAYATYTLGGATTTSPTSPTPNGIIQVGQGFIVKAKNVTTPSVTFTNSLRTKNNSNQFFRNQSIVEANTNLEFNRIWLNLTNNNGVFSQMMVGYMSGATDGIDDLFDGKYIGDSPISLNSIVENKEFVVQGKALPFNTSDVIPLKFSSDISGEYLISIDHIDGIFEGNQDIFLHDSLLNITHNLKTNNYSFQTIDGTFDNRFSIVFENTNLNEVSSIDEPFLIFPNPAKNEFYIKNSNKFNGDTIEIHDVTGKQVFNSKLKNEPINKISSREYSGGVYFITIYDLNNNKFVKKLVIE